MARYARIQDGRVAKVLTVDSLDGVFAPALVWVPAPDGVSEGYTLSGTTFAPPAALPPSVPQQVTMVQASLALHAAPGSAAGKTLLDDVDAAIAASTDPRISLAWKRATVLDRHGLFVAAMAPGLGLDDAKLDALFIAAAKIEV